MNYIAKFEYTPIYRRKMIVYSKGTTKKWTTKIKDLKKIDDKYIQLQFKRNTKLKVDDIYTMQENLFSYLVYQFRSYNDVLIGKVTIEEVAR